MKPYNNLQEELSRKYYDINIIEEQSIILEMHDFIIQNKKLIFPLLQKLERYTSLDVERGKFSKKEIQIFNSIPVPEKHKLQKELPVIIYRGVSLSKNFGEKLVKKVKSKKGKLTYTPIYSNYSSWTTDLETAKSFSEPYSLFPIVFKATLTDKNNAIDIVTFQLITYSLKHYLDSIRDFSTDQSKLYQIIKNVDKIDEKEILVFGKIKCDGVIE